MLRGECWVPRLRVGEGIGASIRDFNSEKAESRDTCTMQRAVLNGTQYYKYLLEEKIMIVIHKIPWRWASNTNGKGLWIPQLSWGAANRQQKSEAMLTRVFRKIQRRAWGKCRRGFGKKRLTVIKKICLMNFSLYKHEETNTGQKYKVGGFLSPRKSRPYKPIITLLVNY